MALRGLVDLYLSATWRLWRELPGLTDLRAAGLGVLRAADDAVAAAAEGFERAHLSIARREEAERLEFVDDLLSGRDAADLLVRGERLGLRLAGPHLVVLAEYAAGVRATRPLGQEIDRLVAEAAAPSPSLTISRGGRLVAVIGVSDGAEASRVAVALARVLARGRPDVLPDDRGRGGSRSGAPIRGQAACAGPTTRPVTRWTWRRASACRTPWWTPRTCSSTRSSCETGRPSPTSSARSSPRCSGRAAAPGHCWPRCRSTTSVAGGGQAARRLHLSVRAVTYRWPGSRNSPAGTRPTRRRDWRCGGRHWRADARLARRAA